MTNLNWKDISLSKDETTFLINEQPIFKLFRKALKFHEPGLAPVSDETGWYHINIEGNAIYSNRYLLAFGYYCGRASVRNEQGWFHINTEGIDCYNKTYDWVGNYMENKCTVRNNQSEYFHIDIFGNTIYPQKYLYAGDYYDSIACVCYKNKLFSHINEKGEFIHNKFFKRVGVYHKGYATALDNKGWFHIDKNGKELYCQRFLELEPFYNAQAFAVTLNNELCIVSANGEISLLGSGIVAS